MRAFAGKRISPPSRSFAAAATSHPRSGSRSQPVLSTPPLVATAATSHPRSGSLYRSATALSTPNPSSSLGLRPCHYFMGHRYRTSDNPRIYRTRTPSLHSTSLVYEFVLAEELIRLVFKIFATWVICQWGRYGLQGSLDGVLGKRDPLPRALRRPLSFIATLLSLTQTTLLLGESMRFMSGFITKNQLQVPVLLTFIVHSGSRILSPSLCAFISSAMASGSLLALTWAFIRYKDFKMNQWRKRLLLNGRGGNGDGVGGGGLDGGNSASSMPSDLSTASPSRSFHNRPAPWEHNVDLSQDSFDTEWRLQEAQSSQFRSPFPGRVNLFQPSEHVSTADRAVELAVQYGQKALSGDTTFNWRRALLPLQSVLNVPIALLGLGAALATHGVSILPLLAVGGASGIALAFGSTFLVSNYLAGLTLIFTRPAAEGERVELRTYYGSLVAGGTVVQVEPLRTQIIGDDGVVTFVSNKILQDLIILNQSRATKESFLGGTRIEGSQVALTHLELGHGATPEQVLRVARELREWLERDPRVDLERPLWVGVQGVGHGGGPELGVLAFTVPLATRRQLWELREDLVLQWVRVRARAEAAESSGHGH